MMPAWLKIHSLIGKKLLMLSFIGCVKSKSLNPQSTPSIYSISIFTHPCCNFRFGTVAAYYCTSPRHKLMGAPKLTCKPDGAWDDRPPMCRLIEEKTPRTPLFTTEKRRPFEPEVDTDRPLLPKRKPDFVRPAPGFPRLRNPGQSGDRTRDQLGKYRLS